MFTVEQIREVALFREAHDDALRRGLEDERIARHHVVRWIIDRCVRDLIETSQAAPRRGGRASRSPTCAGRGGGSSPTAPEMAARVRELKDFLFRNMYRHYRVVRMGDKAGRLLRDLFESYVGEPRQLPPHFQGQLERDGVHRVVCDYIAGMTDRFAVDEHQKLFDPTVRV